MEEKLKLNTKKTVILGFAFFAILLLWQVYNTYCPVFLEKYLKEKMADPSYLIGIIMALDNLFALIFLPLFGALSDKTKSKYGKRKPYIIIGLFASAIVFPFIAIFYYLNIKASLALIIIFMGLTLLIMNVYRNPAVALMPDITAKPLRSKANGIINLIGYIGAISGGAIAMFISTTSEGPIIIVPFIIASVCLLAVMILFIVKVNENKWLDEAEHDLEIGEEQALTLEKTDVDKPLSKGDKRNLILLILAVFFWYMSFNSIETFLSLFCKNILGAPKLAGTLVIVLTISSLLTFIPGAMLANKIGRKGSVLIGLVLCVSGMVVAMTQGKADYHVVVLFIGFILCGIGWALINISSFPMVLEMSNKNNIGKFTGYYYSSSMIAQTLTPVLIGIVMTLKQNLKPLFPYAIIMMATAFMIFFFVNEPKRKKDKNEPKKSVLEHFDN